MRDILEKFNTILESTGLAGRKTGDVFTNPNGDKITFNSIQFFPEGGGKLDKDQLQLAIQELETQAPNVKWQNNMSPRTGGIVLVTFDSEQGPLYFGFFKEEIKADPRQNKVPNEVDGYSYSGKAALKIKSGLTPQDLLTTKKNDLTSDEILLQLQENLGLDNPLYLVAYKVASGEAPPLEFDIPEGVSFSAFRDYFCEILQPMALQRGNFTGDGMGAAEVFLDGSFENTLISFDDSKNEGLCDSILKTTDGRFVKVSTKGGKGAEASTKNLVDTIRELEETERGQKLLEKHREIIDLLTDVKNAGQAGAPLLLGKRFDIISNEDAEEVRKLKGMAPVSVDQFPQILVSKNLLDLANNRQTDNPKKVNLYYHLMAAIAHKAADKVNKETNFSKAAAEILNNGALVQVYTNAKEQKGKWLLKDFNAIYPGDSVKNVYFSASKGYYSTDIKTNFTFKIDRQNKSVKDYETPSTISPIQGEKDFEKSAEKIARGAPLDMSARRQPQDVGREKRK